MRFTMGAAFVAVGIALLWLAATGNLERLGKAWTALRTGETPAAEGDASANPVSLPQLPALPGIGQNSRSNTDMILTLSQLPPLTA